MILTVRTTAGQESLVADILQKKLQQEPLEVYSITVVPDLKGYILVEGDSELTVRRAISDIPHVTARSVIPGEIKVDELSSLLEAKPLMDSIKKGAKVKLVAGPFKGEMARVLRVNETREEVTVELLEAAVKIPITIRAEHIRVLK